MGTGVSPATGFLKESGFSLEEDGGIAVDEYLRVKGEQNIYAIGDIAHYTQYPDKFQRRVEHWNVAGNMVRPPFLLRPELMSVGTRSRTQYFQAKGTDRVPEGTCILVVCRERSPIHWNRRRL